MMKTKQEQLTVEISQAIGEFLFLQVLSSVKCFHSGLLANLHVNRNR